MRIIADCVGEQKWLRVCSLVEDEVVVRSTALRTDWSCDQPRAYPRCNTNELDAVYRKNHGNTVNIGVTGVLPLTPFM